MARSRLVGGILNGGSRRFLAASVVAAALAAACAGQDASRDDVVEAMEDAGLDTEQADCIGDGLDDELNDDQLNDVSEASDLDDLGEQLQTTVDSVLETCLTGGASIDDTEDSTTTTEG